MDFGLALAVYLCALAVVMVSSQILLIFTALRTVSAPPPGLALSNSVLLSPDDKGPDNHSDESESDLNDNQCTTATLC